MTRYDHPTDLELQAYADGELPADEASRVEGHVVDCKACGSVLAELRATREWLAMDAPDESPSPVWAGVVAATEQRTKPLFSPAFSFGAAAACAAGIVLGVIVGVPQVEQQESNDQLAWSTPGAVWNGTSGSSMLDVYTGLSQSEGTDGS